jgi:hypothetical protein
MQLLVYQGGCIEIDTDSIIYDDNNNPIDIKITHLITNSSSITFSSILDVILKVIKYKIDNNIITGPILMTFDNKHLKYKNQHNIFWKLLHNILSEKNMSDVFMKIDEKNLSDIQIKEMTNKILIRWGQNQNCGESVDNSKEIGYDVCPPNEKIIKDFTLDVTKWVHLAKGKSKFDTSFISENNKSRSISVQFINTLDANKLNLYTIINTQRNMLRYYPHLTSELSNNYNNIVHFRNGVQIIAINIQTIDNPCLLNKAVFMPSNGLPCVSNDILENKCINEWNNSDLKPLGYRLKPLWLIGLVPYPKYHNLKITISNIEIFDDDKISTNKTYEQFNICYGLNNICTNLKINEPITLHNIDVTVPFFVITTKSSSLSNIITNKLSNKIYTNGFEIPWVECEDDDIVKNEKTQIIHLYKFNRSAPLNYNDVILEENHDNDCDKSSLFSSKRYMKITMTYSWIRTNIEVESTSDYNVCIKKLRELYYNLDTEKNTSYFLEHLSELNEYQQRLQKLIEYQQKIITKKINGDYIDKIINLDEIDNLNNID